MLLNFLRWCGCKSRRNRRVIFNMESNGPDILTIEMLESACSPTVNDITITMPDLFDGVELVKYKNSFHTETHRHLEVTQYIDNLSYAILESA